MTAGRRSGAIAGFLGLSILLLSACEQLALRDQIEQAVLPPSPTTPWVVSFGNRSVTLSWAEPSDADMGAAELIATPDHVPGAVPIQAVVKAGDQGATINLPSNNVGYTFTVYMADKGGNVSSGGVSTANGYSQHYRWDTASISNYLRTQVLFFSAQLPVTTVTNFSGSGAGVETSYDTYTYDGATGLPSVITTYTPAGDKLTKRQISYAPGSTERVLDLYYNWAGTDWVLYRIYNTYHDEKGRVTKTEYYGGPPTTPLKLMYTSTYSYDDSGVVAGWVTYDGTEAVYRNTTYLDLGAKEEWIIGDADGVIVGSGLTECDYDELGRVTQTLRFSPKDVGPISRTEFEYDDSGNLLKITSHGGTPLQQQSYNIYSY